MINSAEKKLGLIALVSSPEMHVLKPDEAYGIISLIGNDHFGDKLVEAVRNVAQCVIEVRKANQALKDIQGTVDGYKSSLDSSLKEVRRVLEEENGKAREWKGINQKFVDEIFK